MIYIVVFMSSIFFAWLAERSKDKCIIILCSVISILIPSLLGGLRHYTVGADSAGYGIAISNLAMKTSSFLGFLENSNVEPGCRVIFYYGTRLFDSYSGAFFFFELITMTCFYIGAYRHKKIVPLTLTMLVFYFILYCRTYNEIRQSIAAAIIFMGLNYLESKKYLKFLLHVVVGITFHYSALITVFLFLCFHAITASKIYSENNIFKFISVFGTIILLLFAFQIMNVIVSGISFMNKYAGYLDRINLGYNAVRKPLIVLYFGELLMFIFYHKGAIKVLTGSNGELNVNFYEFSIIFCLSYLIGVAFFDRLIFYTDFANILVIAALPFFVKEKNLRFLVFFAVLITVFVFWYYKFLYLNTFGVWPYRSILD
ncbi:MAG: EpsG family protein [Synergistaceae bacterium]|nr:EpsG family protein [Synergistaceae bacterium]